HFVISLQTKQRARRHHFLMDRRSWRSNSIYCCCKLSFQERYSIGYVAGNVAKRNSCLYRCGNMDGVLNSLQARKEHVLWLCAVASSLKCTVGQLSSKRSLRVLNPSRFLTR